MAVQVVDLAGLKTIFIDMAQRMGAAKSTMILVGKPLCSLSMLRFVHVKHRG